MVLSAHVPDLGSLELLLTVARTGSLGAAGRELGLTQQAVSARIRTVEQRVGVPVVHRGPRGSRLTDAGALVADWPTRVLGAAEELDAAIASLRGRRDAQLAVAASLTVAEYLLPGWLVKLGAEQAAAGRARARVNLTVHNSDRVAADVLAGEVQLGFVEGPDIPPGLSARAVAPTSWSSSSRAATPGAAVGSVPKSTPGHLWSRGRSARGPGRRSSGHWLRSLRRGRRRRRWSSPRRRRSAARCSPARARPC